VVWVRVQVDGKSRHLSAATCQSPVPGPDHEEEITVWSRLDSTRLAKLRVGRSALNKMTSRDQHSWSTEHLSLVKKDKTEIAEQIKDLENQKKVLDVELANLNKEVAEAKQNMKAVEGQHSMKDREMHAEIESCFLEPYGIGHGAHHGGDLTSPSVKALMANASDIFDGLESYLTFCIDTGNSVAEALQEQNDMRTCVYKNCLQNFDGVFSLV